MPQLPVSPVPSIWGPFQSLLILPPQILLCQRRQQGGTPQNCCASITHGFVKGFGERGTAAPEATVLIREDLFQYVVETI